MENTCFFQQPLTIRTWFSSEISVMLMSIMLLSPGMDDVTWLSLAFMSIIVDDRDGGLWYVSFCPCFVLVLWCPSSLSLSIRLLGSVVTHCMPFNNTLFSCPSAAVYCSSDAHCCCLCHWWHGVYLCWLVCSWGIKFQLGAKAFMFSSSAHGNVHQSFCALQLCSWESTLAFESVIKFFTWFWHKFQVWIPMKYCILCVLHKCRVHRNVLPIFVVQQICPTNLSPLPSDYSSSSLSVVFLYNVVVKGFSALLSRPFLSEPQQETLCHSSCVYAT